MVVLQVPLVSPVHSQVLHGDVMMVVRCDGLDSDENDNDGVDKMKLMITIYNDDDGDDGEVATYCKDGPSLGCQGSLSSPLQ